MKKTFIILAIALIVMHFNQSLNVAYWVALAVFVITSLRAAYKLDRDERNSESH